MAVKVVVDQKNIFFSILYGFDLHFGGLMVSIDTIQMRTNLAVKVVDHNFFLILYGFDLHFEGQMVSIDTIKIDFF